METQAAPVQREWMTFVLILLVGIALLLVCYGYWARSPVVEASTQSRAQVDKQVEVSLPVAGRREIPQQ